MPIGPPTTWAFVPKNKQAHNLRIRVLAQNLILTQMLIGTKHIGPNWHEFKLHWHKSGLAQKVWHKKSIPEILLVQNEFAQMVGGTKWIDTKSLPQKRLAQKYLEIGRAHV